MLKTVKDMMNLCSLFPNCNYECTEINYVELKQEAIKDIKHFQNPDNFIKKLAYDSTKDIIKGKIEYIKWKFNITEDDLK